MDFALTDMFILVKNRLFSQKPAGNFTENLIKSMPKSTSHFQNYLVFSVLRATTRPPPHSMWCDMQKVLPL